MRQRFFGAPIAVLAGSLVATSTLAINIESASENLAEMSFDPKLASQDTPAQTVEAYLTQTEVTSDADQLKGGTRLNDPFGIGEFIFGLFLIPFSMVMLWKNEAKLVTFMKLLTKGKEAVKTLDCENPDEANEFDLAHMTGTTVNTDEIEDKDFGIKVPNSYRLKRKVEMYQWKEHVHH